MEIPWADAAHRESASLIMILGDLLISAPLLPLLRRVPRQVCSPCTSFFSPNLTHT